VPIEAVIFDIGDVLEVNPRTGWPGRWARQLSIDLDQFERRLGALWGLGSTGGRTLAEIETAMHAIGSRDNAQTIAELEALLAQQAR
jgi:putative hydrolase of the HAD superfamily